MEIGFGRTVDLAFDEAVLRTEAALAREGFGVLTRIDVRETLKKKLGEEMPPFLILGACNPPLAHRALTRAPEVGLLLPCNVVVRQVDGNRVRVEAINAEMMAEAVPGGGLEEIAAQVNRLLARVIESI